MAALKKDIALKYLVPMVVAFAGLATALGLDTPFGVGTLGLHTAAAAGVAGLAALVLEEMLPRPVKECIVFWRRTERAPGFRAFSVIGPKDPRIDQTILASLLPAAPMTPRQQNSLWYAWLKETESDAGVAQNHRNSLILRDATALAALLLVLPPSWGLLAPSAWPSALLLEVVCLLSYALLMISARHSAERLVGNVIALKAARAVMDQSRLAPQGSRS
jgi:hypothetical protein